MSLQSDINALGRGVTQGINHNGKAAAGTNAMLAAHFACHMQGLSRYSQEEYNCHYCQLRKLSTYPHHRVTIINQVDKEGLPKTFRFVDQVIPGANITIPGEEFIASCTCDYLVQDVCITNQCSCLSDIETEQIPGFKKNAYHADGKLRGAYLEGLFPIYECGPRCGCSNRCPNRVVQRGRTVALEIFKTTDGRGWGVKAKETIKKGHFVDCYFGELLTPVEAQRRRDEAVSAQQKDVYLFALDKFEDKESTDVLLRVPFEIDGEFLAGPTRFINHSCDPNLRIFAVVKHSADRYFHTLAFFAKQDIAADTELTFDYNAGRVRDKNNKKKQKCLCGSQNCRGYLF